MRDKNMIGIYGAGALGQEVLEILYDIGDVNNTDKEVCFIADYFDKKEKYDIPIYTLSQFAELNIFGKEVVIAVGEPFKREEMKHKVFQKGLRLAEPIIHPGSKISRKATVNRGCVVSFGCFVSANALIGENTYLQPNCGIGHNVKIGENSVISAAVRIAGYTEIGRNTYIGMSVPVRDRLTIGSGCIISMGAVVQRDVPDYMIAMGNPARPVKKNEEHSVF